MAAGDDVLTFSLAQGVKIQGLNGRGDLNGQVGKVLGLVSGGRYPVKVLTLAATAAPPAASASHTRTPARRWPFAARAPPASGAKTSVELSTPFPATPEIAGPDLAKAVPAARRRPPCMREPCWRAVWLGAL